MDSEKLLAALGGRNQVVLQWQQLQLGSRTGWKLDKGMNEDWVCLHCQEKHTQREGKFYYFLLIYNLRRLLSVSSRENFIHQIQYREMNSCLKADDLDMLNSSGVWFLKGQWPGASDQQLPLRLRHSTLHNSGKKSQTRINRKLMMHVRKKTGMD